MNETGPPSVVLGHARDDVAARALTVAVDMARRLRATVHVAHLITLDDYSVRVDSPNWESDAQAVLASQRSQVAELLGRTDLPWTYQVARGDPCRFLCRLAEEHDALCIVAGTHGDRFGERISRAVRGRSVSRGLLRFSSRPVLLVPGPESAVPLGGGRR